MLDDNKVQPTKDEISIPNTYTNLINPTELIGNAENLAILEENNRNKLRSSVSSSLFLLIFIQTVFVFGGVAVTGLFGGIKEKESFFTLIIGGTLGQSYLLIQIMVKYLFNGDLSKKNEKQSNLK